VLIVAAVLIALLAVAHSVIGEVRLIGPIAARGDLPTLYGTTKLTGATLRFAWHVTSVLALGLAAIMFAIAFDAPPDIAVCIIGWTLIASGVLPLVFTRGRHFAWAVFFAAGALCLLSAAGF
jgi:hypothetical protein